MKSNCRICGSTEHIKIQGHIVCAGCGKVLKPIYK